MRSWIACVVGLALATAASGALAAVFTATYSSSGATIDGVLSGSEWGSATSYPISMLRGDGLTSHTSNVSFMYDDDYFYVGVDSDWARGWDVYWKSIFDGNGDGVLSGSVSAPHVDVSHQAKSPGAWYLYDGYILHKSAAIVDEVRISPPAGVAQASSGTGSVDYEFRIPLSDLDTGPGQTLRYMANLNVDGIALHSYYSANAGSVANGTRGPLYTWDSVYLVSAPSKPDPGTFVDPDPSSATNVVFMVHGWRDSPALFTTDDDNDLGTTNMVANIENALAENGNTDWDVRTYGWSAAAAITDNDLLVMGPLGLIIPSPRAKRAAAAQGQALAHKILNDQNYNRETGADGNVHLVAHSLGGRVINETARILAQDSTWNGKVHLTFLDAYTPDGWENSFGENATWAEHYYDRGLAVNTQDDFVFAHNVDVTALLDDPGSPGENHKWPVRWYDSTISNDEGYGFPTGIESLAPSETWSSRSEYPYPGDPPELVKSALQSIDPVTHMINTSSTGSIDMSSGHVTLGTGSPVWINMTLSTEEFTNFLEFDFEFISEADGLLSVHLDDQLLGLFYERFALDGQQDSGTLFFEDDLEPGFHVLAFRVDPLSDATSFVTVSGIEAGHLTLVPEPSTFILLAIGALGLLAYGRRRKQRNFGEKKLMRKWIACVVGCVSLWATSDALAAVTVSGASNIYGAGHAVPPAPAGHGAGILPPMVAIPSGTSVVTFPEVFGEVGFGPDPPTEQGIGPDGQFRPAGDGIQIDSYGGISGIVDMDKFFFLAGVFLDDSEPADPAPARLDFTGVENFSSISPQLGQTFFVGDGRTGTGSGSLQEFNVPTGATRLFWDSTTRAGLETSRQAGTSATLAPIAWRYK